MPNKFDKHGDNVISKWGYSFLVGKWHTMPIPEGVIPDQQTRTLWRVERPGVIPPPLPPDASQDVKDERFFSEYFRKHGADSGIPVRFYRHFFQATLEHCRGTNS